ncbi:MAG TPA: hypothetical protein VE715_08230 [Blastocatellia bacterium]|nr:hypothetical protein [Blastocatellia bacterium]
MTEPERIKNIEEHITLEGLLPGVNLDGLPPEESARLKRAVLDLYRLSHARGFKSGADHAMNSIANFIEPRRNASQMQWLKGRVSARAREYWQDYKTSLRSIRATVIRKFREG